MARQDIATESTSFSQIDDLTKEISELAGMVNARLIIDDDKVRGLKSLNGATVQSTGHKVVNG